MTILRYGRTTANRRKIFEEKESNDKRKSRDKRKIFGKRRSFIISCSMIGSNWI